MNSSWRMYGWSLVLLMIILIMCSCDSDVRIGVRNIEEMGKYLATSADGTTAATGEVIQAEAKAVGDSLDTGPLGLWVEKSEPSITAEDLAVDIETSLNANLEHAEKIDDARKAEVSVGGGILALFGVLAGGSGLGLAAGAAAWVLTNRKKLAKLKTAVSALVSFGVDMTNADTEFQAEAVKTKHARLQTSLGIRDIITPELDKAKAEKAT